MASQRRLFVAFIAIYALLIAAALLIIIPERLNLNEYHGHCLLFTTGTFTEFGQFEAQWAPRIYCDAINYLAYILLAVATVQFIRFVVFLWQNKEPTLLIVFMESLLSCIMSVPLVFTAIFVSVGFNRWCQTVTEKYSTCKIATTLKLSLSTEIVAKNFYTEMILVQVGLWTSCLVWLALFATIAVKFVQFLTKLQKMMETANALDERYPFLKKLFHGMCGVKKSRKRPKQDKKTKKRSQK